MAVTVTRTDYQRITYDTAVTWAKLDDQLLILTKVVSSVPALRQLADKDILAAYREWSGVEHTGTGRLEP